MENDSRVTIITGRRDSGKTSWCADNLVAVNAEKSGLGRIDGILSLKVLLKGKRVGYDVKRISTEETAAFARIKDVLPKGWREAYSFGMFSFSMEALEVVRLWLRSFSENIDTVVIDEIGPLELKGFGFFREVKSVLENNEKFKKIYIVVRRGLVEKVCLKFNIKKYSTVTVDNYS